MARQHNINGVKVPFTAEEEAQVDADKIVADAKIQAEKDAEIQKATDKANAKAKLIAGEALTEAEADTIVI
jgi:hypothetical protein